MAMRPVMSLAWETVMVGSFESPKFPVQEKGVETLHFFIIVREAYAWRPN